MVERIRRVDIHNSPEQWDVYGPQVVRVERECFKETPKLMPDGRTMHRLYARKGAIGLVYVDERRAIPDVMGHVVAVPVDGLRDASVKDISSYVLHGSGIGMYCFSLAVSPCEQGKGVGTRLLKDLIGHAAIEGYQVLVSHAREGASLEIHKNLGAAVLKTYKRPKWYGAPDAYHFNEIDISRTRIVKPFDAEQASGCGPGALAMVLDYHGMPESQSILGEELGATIKGGTSSSRIIHALRRRGFRSRECSRRSIGDLEQELMRGCPPLVSWFSKDTAHWSVVDDIDKHGQVYLKDPAFGGTTIFSTRDFQEVWFGYSASRLPREGGFHVGLMVTARR